MHNNYVGFHSQLNKTVVESIDPVVNQTLFLPSQSSEIKKYESPQPGYYTSTHNKMKPKLGFIATVKFQTQISALRVG